MMSAIQESRRRLRQRLAFPLVAAVTVSLAACGGGSNDVPSSTVTTSPSVTASPSSATAASPAPTASPPPPSESADAATDEIVGTVVRFSNASTSVDVTIGEDNAAVRDFLSMLPLTLTLEEYAGREKIAYLPRELEHSGSPGSDPEDGDLIYYVPWGNLGFYYNTAGIGSSDQTIHIGTYHSSLDQLEQLEGEVTVGVAS